MTSSVQALVIIQRIPPAHAPPQGAVRAGRESAACFPNQLGSMQFLTAASCRGRRACGGTVQVWAAPSAPAQPCAGLRGSLHHLNGGAGGQQVETSSTAARRPAQRMQAVADPWEVQVHMHEPEGHEMTSMHARPTTGLLAVSRCVVEAAAGMQSRRPAAVEAGNAQHSPHNPTPASHGAHSHTSKRTAAPSQTDQNILKHREPCTTHPNPPP